MHTYFRQNIGGPVRDKYLIGMKNGSNITFHIKITTLVTH
jgi:hypothetical protein